MEKLINKKDSLGDRMKNFYEGITKYFLPRKTYTIIRIDGKAFHTYTKGLKRPFDDKFVNDMNETALYLCKNIQGAKLAFVQSDEISILLTDFDGIATDAWFGGNIQKMASVSASMATAVFNSLRSSLTLAMFDSRVFTISSYNEVVNYFIWRQQDTIRNSVSSVAQSLFTHKALHGKNVKDMQDMCYDVGSPWNEFDKGLKQGRIVSKPEQEGAGRDYWMITPAEMFACDNEYSKSLIPVQE